MAAALGTVAEVLSGMGTVFDGGCGGVGRREDAAHEGTFKARSSMYRNVLVSKPACCV
eukprot:SAG11_NODE_14708_length_602_cov_1.333996_1_plen_57_part_10